MNGKMNRPTARDFWSDRRGAIAPLGAMMLVFVIGFAALALDMGHNYVVKNRLQATADSTSLAGVSQLPDQAAMVVKAQEYAEKNMPAAEYGTVLANVDVIAGQWDPATRTFTPALEPLNAVQTTTRQQSASGNAAPVFLGAANPLAVLPAAAAMAVIFVLKHRKKETLGVTP